MKVATDGLPEIGPSARTLGVRTLDRAPHHDVNVVLDTDMVLPGEGGMSVAPDDPALLPLVRRPTSLGGFGLDPVWEIDETKIGPQLRIRIDKPDHGFVEPMQAMTLFEYNQALAATRQNWKRIV